MGGPASCGAWFQSLAFVFSDWPRWKGQMDLSWQTAALQQEVCKCIVSWGRLKGFGCERRSWWQGPRKATKVTPSPARDLFGAVCEGGANDCLWAKMEKQRWPGRRGGLYSGCGACTQGKYVMVETRHISDDRHVGGESLKAGRSLLLECGKFLVDWHSLLVLWSQK